MNLFTNAATAVFWFFSRYCNRHYNGRRDTATNERLTERNKKFEFQKVFQLPWMFWAVLAFSLFQTSTASTFSQNATELAEQRFDIDSIQAGWYSSLSQYAGMLDRTVLATRVISNSKLRLLPRSLSGCLH
jgi:hypothetical protein